MKYDYLDNPGLSGRGACSHKHPLRGRQEGQGWRSGWESGSSGQSDVGPEARGVGRFQKLQRAEKWILPQEEHDPADPLILGQGVPFWAPDPSFCKMLDLCSFKPLTWR